MSARSDATTGIFPSTKDKRSLGPLDRQRMSEAAAQKAAAQDLQSETDQSGHPDTEHADHHHDPHSALTSLKAVTMMGGFHKHHHHAEASTDQGAQADHHHMGMGSLTRTVSKMHSIGAAAHRHQMDLQS